MNRSTKTRLGIDALEARECPAAFVYDDYCGNGIPRPPIPHKDLAAVSRVSLVANPGIFTATVVSLPAVSGMKGIIIEGV